EIRRRLARLQFAPTCENAIVEELAQHLDESYEELLACGMSEAEARRRWADFAGLNQNPDKGAPDRLGSKKKTKSRLKLSPHDLRRTAVTRALSLGFTYSQAQSMTGHKNIRMVVKYDHERGNLEENAINFLHYDEKKVD